MFVSGDCNAVLIAMLVVLAACLLSLAIRARGSNRELAKNLTYSSGRSNRSQSRKPESESSCTAGDSRCEPLLCVGPESSKRCADIIDAISPLDVPSLPDCGIGPESNHLGVTHCPSIYTIHVAEVKNRRAYIYVPQAKVPPLGFPFVFAWSNSDSNDALGAPVVPILSTTDGKQQLFLQLLRHGVAIVFTTVEAFNKYSYMPSGHPFYPFECDVSSPMQTCWAGGYNADSAYLSYLFDRIYTSEDYFLDTSLMVMIGFGAGSHMTSRAINSFPDMRTLHQQKFPEIRAAILVGDGGMYCYAYDDDTPSLPDIFLPCDGANNLSEKGCCARGLTETEYSMGSKSYSEHPPVLLLHNKQNVSYAATDGSRLYYDAMKANGAKACFLEAIDTPDSGSSSTIEMCQVNPALSFIFLHLGVAPTTPAARVLETLRREGSLSLEEMERRIFQAKKQNERVHGRPWE